MGYFPKLSKTPILKLILKQNNDHTKLRNYRPISLLEVTGKIKKNTHRRTKEYLETNKLLPNTTWIHKG